MGHIFPPPSSAAANADSVGSGQFGESIIIRLMAERDAALAAQALAERRFHATFAQAPVGIAHVAPDGRFLMVNEQFAAITGHSVIALMQHGFQQITHPDDLASDLDHVTRLLSGAADRYVMEKRYLTPDGGIVWVNLTVALIRNEKGAPDFFVSVIEDVSEVKRAHEQALRDPLTGLWNRRGYGILAARELSRASRQRQSMALIYLDLDAFKSVNDAGGHPAGDACLTAVARMLERVSRPADIVARLGGDEFAVLMPGCDIETGVAAAERLRGGLAMIETPMTGSFGVWAGVPDDAMDADIPLASADAAMFAAKRAGRDGVRAMA